MEVLQNRGGEGGGMNIDWVVLTGKVPETVIVLIFVWFTLKILSVFQDFLVARDASYLSNLIKVGDMHNKDLTAVSKDLQNQTAIMTKIVERMSDDTELLQFIAADARRRNSTN